MWIKIILALPLIISSCSGTKSTSAKENKSETHQTAPERNYQAEKFTKATIVDFRALDGCNFLLELEDGRKLNPGNVDEKYRVAGMKVWVRYEKVDLMNTCMSGQTIKIIEIAERKE